jgi:mannonate dehydratase
MKDRIEAVEVSVTSPTRNFVTVVVRTESGLVGLGDATLNGRELSVASYLRDHLAPLLIGRDALRIEDTWQFLYKGAYWRGGPVGMASIGAIDMALWDILGKKAQLPLYQLLGGAQRTGCQAYRHVFGRDIEEVRRKISDGMDQGFRAFRVQIAFPGMIDTYGIPPAGAELYEPAVPGNTPAEYVWDATGYLSTVPSLLADIRREVGDQVQLLHDVHHRLSPIDGARFARDVEPARLFWLEDVTPSDDFEGWRIIRNHSTTPLATGEILTSLPQCLTLVGERLIDYLRVSPTHAGGVTGVKKLLSFAEAHQVRSGIHGPTDVSPIGLAASIHIDYAISNFGIQEYQERPALVDELFHHAYRIQDGMLVPGDEPGLGVKLDDRLTEDIYPYSPAYLPVNRMTDGTWHEW